MTSPSFANFETEANANVNNWDILQCLQAAVEMREWFQKHQGTSMLAAFELKIGSKEDASSIIGFYTRAMRIKLRSDVLLRNEVIGSKEIQAVAKRAFLCFFATISGASRTTYFLPSINQTKAILEFVGQRTLYDAGAGAGVVARLLRQLGVKVHAVDNFTMATDGVEGTDMLGALEMHKDQISKDGIVLGFFNPEPGQERCTETLHWFHKHGGMRVLTSGTSAANAAASFWVYLQTYFRRTLLLRHIRVFPDTPFGDESQISKVDVVPIPLYVWECISDKSAPIALPKVKSSELIKSAAENLKETRRRLAEVGSFLGIKSPVED